MTKIFTKNLFDKHIMGIDGTETGILHDIIADFRTGNLLDLVIKPDIALNTEGFRMEDGFLLLPFDSVRAVSDYIVVDKKVLAP